MDPVLYVRRINRCVEGKCLGELESRGNRI